MYAIGLSAQSVGSLAGMRQRLFVGMIVKLSEAAARHGLRITLLRRAI
jgi:hypothetical protein